MSQDKSAHLSQDELRAELAAMWRLQQLSLRLGQPGELAVVLQEIIDAAIEITGSDMGNIQLLEGDQLRIRAHFGFERPFLDFFDTVHDGQAACGSALERGGRVIVEDVATSPVFDGAPAARAAMLAAGAQAVQSTPLVARSGTIVGMFSTHYRSHRRPSEGELHLLDLLARKAADVIERHLAEETIARSEERFRSLISVITDVPWVTDATGAFVTKQEAWARYTGQTWEEHRGFGWANAFHPDDRDEVLTLWQRARDTRATYQAAGRLWHAPSQQYRYVAAGATPLLYADGSVREWVGTCTDVDNRVRHEQALAEQKRLLDLSWDAIIVCDPDDRIRYWNRGAEALYGYTADQALGTIMHDLLRTSEFSDNQQTIQALLRQEGRWSGEVSTVRADGRHITTASRWVLDRSSDGKPNAILKTNNDITARKEAEDTRKLLIDELNHRAKNMLATVQAIATQSLRRSKMPSDFVSGFTGRIQALARAHTLLTDAAWQEADLATLIHDQLLMDADADPRISSTGATVLIEPQLALHLALMVHELGTNARKYGALSIPDGKLSVSWSIHTNGERQLHLRWAEDNGSKRKLPPIGQAGFGSTLVQTIVGRGQAHMTSAAHGVEWNIRIPLPQEPTRDRRLPPTPLQQLTDQAKDPAKHATLMGKRVLVVEDEPIIALELAAILETAEVNVIGPARSLNAAHELIKKHKADAALLDVNIGGQRIDELAAALSRNKVPFAFLTGYRRETLPPPFQAALLVPKPFRADQILAGLTTLLSDSQHRVAPLRARRH